MSRSFPLSVERLEDRCVPAVTFSRSIHLPRLDATVTVSVQPGNAPTAPAQFHFVIDAILINPNAPPKPLTFDFTIPLPPLGGLGGGTPSTPIPPTDPPPGTEPPPVNS